MNWQEHAHVFRIIVENSAGYVATDTVNVYVDPADNPPDVNWDLVVDLEDAVDIAQWYIGLNPPDFHNTSADCNGDGTIDMQDGLWIMQYYVGLRACWWAFE